jgi:hypothetical protein
MNTNNIKSQIVLPLWIKTVTWWFSLGIKWGLCGIYRRVDHFLVATRDNWTLMLSWRKYPAFPFYGNVVHRVLMALQVVFPRAQRAKLTENFRVKACGGSHRMNGHRYSGSSILGSSLVRKGLQMYCVGSRIVYEVEERRT